RGWRRRHGLRAAAQRSPTRARRRQGRRQERRAPDLPFFFQAEDGIRDLYVTGVQTCALPSVEKPSLRGASILIVRDGCLSFMRRIGRASCRERVLMWVGSVSFKKKRKG